MAEERGINRMSDSLAALLLTPAPILITCADCGNEFNFSADEQSYFREKGYQPPKRCRHCRRDRQLKAPRSAAERRGIAYDVVCAKCGVETTVPFYPSGKRPVYCRSCFLGNE